MRRMALALLMVVAVAAVVPASAEARTRVYRGQTRGWFLNPGRTMTVYYYPDGRSARVYWKQNWYNWAQSNSFVTISIYVSSGRYGPWYYMYTTSVGPYYRSLPLWITNSRATYVFVIRCYRAGAPVYIGIY